MPTPAQEPVHLPPPPKTTDVTAPASTVAAHGMQGF
jgi:hypothetical protein